MKQRFLSGLIFLAFALAALSASEHSKPNAGLPLVKATMPMFPPRPAWRLFTACPIDRRNVPIIEERSA